jgi:hypothetical protein
MTTVVVSVLALAVLRWVAVRATRRETAGLLLALLLPAAIVNPASALKSGVDQSTFRLRSKPALMRLRLCQRAHYPTPTHQTRRRAERGGPS